MIITILPKEYYLSRILKNSITNSFRTKTSLKSFVSFKIYILSQTKPLSWEKHLLDKIIKLEVLSKRSLKTIEKSFQDYNFKRYFNNFRRAYKKERNLFFYSNGLIFIKLGEEKELVCFMQRPTENLKEWASNLVSISNYLYRWIIYSNLKGRFLILHAAGIVRGREGYLFLGNGSSGKSTLCNLSKGFQILDDDMINLEYAKKDFLIYSAIAPKQKVRLKYIFFIEKSKENRLIKLSKKEAIKEGFTCVLNFRKNFYHCDFSNRTINLAIDLFRKAEAYRLHFRKSPEFWELIDSIDQKKE